MIFVSKNSGSFPLSTVNTNNFGNVFYHTTLHYQFLSYKETIKKWKNETGCQYPIVSDVERSLYQTFHLPSSLKHTWDIKSQTWYANQICLNRTLYSMLEYDDPHQLGGDVIVHGNEARLVMVHRSISPTDRPSIEEIINVIQNYSLD